MAAAAAAGIAAAVWAVGDGAAGLLYLVVYAAAVLPGMPLGFALFGARHPAGWIAGIAIGYALAAVMLWAVIAIGAAGTAGFAVALLVTACASWLVVGIRPAAVEIPPWTPAATCSLAAVVVLTVALAAPPLAAVGQRDAAGNQRYRAYFTADFVWHAAMTAELTHFVLPPHNPYLAPQRIHYYWGYFLVPAAVAATGPPPLRDVERCLRLNALASGVLLIATVFLAAFVAVRRAAAAAAGTALALTAASLEGWYGIARLWSRHQPLSNLRDMNIDALTAWYFQGHRLDGLPRCLWYVPQHSMSYALGLIALAEVTAAGSEGGWAGLLIAGAALGGSALLNPFVGGVFSAVWGFAVAIDAMRRGGGRLARIGRHAVAAVPVVLSIGWCVSNGMVEGAGGALELGVTGASLHAPAATLALSLGPVLVAGLAGIAVTRESRRRLVPAMILAAASLCLLYVVRLDVDHEWVPFRAGQMLLAALAILSAAWFAAARSVRGRWTIVAAGIVLFLAGVPTTAIDAYNAQDVWNTHEAPGFKWTLVLSPEKQAAFAWIRHHTPRSAIVQMEPVVRDRDAWSLIPSFAQRRMAAGLPISLLRTPEYRDRSEQVRTIYTSEDAPAASRIAHALHIRYLYVDEQDRTAYPGTAKFDHSPAWFTPVFSQGLVAVYEVK